MKQLVQKSIAIILFFCVFNANAKSKLTINTSMHTAMKVIIDGKKFYSQDNCISIRNLRPGCHNIVIFYIKSGRDFNNYCSNGQGSFWKKAVSKQVVVRNNFQYDITVNRFGRAFYDQDECYSNHSNGWNGANDFDDDFDSEDDDMNNYFDYDNGFDENYDDFEYFRKDKKHPYTNNNSPANYGSISNKLFEQIKQSMQNQDYESSRLLFAKQSVENKSISTKQVIELVELLDMESSKLDFAKHAYKSTFDKDRYFSVINSFSMQSSKDDLMKYIKKR